MNRNKMPKTSKWNKPQYKDMLDFIEKNSFGKCLDIGCGEGELEYIIENIKGIDIIKSDNWNNKCRMYDGLHPPKEKFDTIIFNNSWEHIKYKGYLVERLKEFNKDSNFVLIVPTTKFLLGRYPKVVEMIFRRALGLKRDAIRHWLVHEPEIWGDNFLGEFKYFNNWDFNVEKYFLVDERKVLYDGKAIGYRVRLK